MFFFPVFTLTITAHQFTEILDRKEIYYPASVREKITLTKIAWLWGQISFYLIKTSILIMQLESSIFLYQKGKWAGLSLSTLANKIYLVY